MNTIRQEVTITVELVCKTIELQDKLEQMVDALNVFEKKTEKAVKLEVQLKLS